MVWDPDSRMPLADSGGIRQNSMDGFRSHVYLTIITMALTTAFRVWMDDQDAKNQQGEETGIRKFREKGREKKWQQTDCFRWGSPCYL